LSWESWRTVVDGVPLFVRNDYMPLPLTLYVITLRKRTIWLYEEQGGDAGQAAA